MNHTFAIPLGGSVPAHTPHAISVSLPKWADNVGYEEGDKRVVGVMETGYPRFFIHRSIQKLAAMCEAKFGRDNEQCILLPTARVAQEAKDFLAAQTSPLQSRIVEFVVCPSQSAPSSSNTSMDIVELHILLFDRADFPIAKSFWQHTGDGISSRMAERALYLLGETPAGAVPGSPTEKEFCKPSRNRHYSRPVPATSLAPPATATAGINGFSQINGHSDEEPVEEEELPPDLSTYLEERYGRNLPPFNAPLAKQALKRRIAGGLLPSDEAFGEANVTRGKGKTVTEDDVYLYPGGMSAIWHAHDICRIARGKGKEGKSVCFGFPYTDTYKILSKWGPGCHFFGHGDTKDLDALEKTLETEPILALFAEFPSNPLLRSPDLKRIRALADKYGFVVVVDETIGNFINVEIAEYCDIIVSSLTKIFSGDANVMGGSLVLNPSSTHYATLKAVLDEHFEDLYFAEDTVYMERNSRNYRERIKRVNDNAYDVTEYLHSRSLECDPSGVIKKVWYPRYSTPETYQEAQRFPTLGKGGYGGLFSLTFTSLEASQAFYDTLQCAKGPSLGTSFTLASPYTILAHYVELDWAAQYGVEAGLVRISVGQEDGDVLRRWFEQSVKAAEEAGAKLQANGTHVNGKE